MPRNFIKRYLPSPDKLREYSALRPLGNFLENEDLWHLNRRSASGAAFIGVFCCFLPMPFQMLPAGLLAMAFRCNLPMSLALVWLTNPITMPPMLYFTYRFGAWLLGREISIDQVDLSFDWLLANMVNVGYPLLFGSLICGWVAGITAYVLVRVTWRVHAIRRWRKRRQRRQEAALNKQMK